MLPFQILGSNCQPLLLEMLLCLLEDDQEMPAVYYHQVDIYNSASNTWSTSSLSQARCGLAAATVENLALFGGGWNGKSYSDVVDIYDCSSNTWKKTSLSQPHNFIVATNVRDLALFAAGFIAKN